MAVALLCGACGGGGESGTRDDDAGGGPSRTPTESTAPTRGGGPDEAGTLLDNLTVRTPGTMDGYARERFPHWAAQGRNCDTREAVLQRDGSEVRTDAQCEAVAGSWTSMPDGKVWTRAGDVDIDHVVPLAEAWRSGAREWDDKRRAAFANDMARPQLLVVTDELNQSKGDSPPDEWKPPLKSYWCGYAENWVTVKHHYELSVTAGEKTALRSMLRRCEL